MDSEENESTGEGEVSCGRTVFREADLAFLLIEQQRMFPLAELLASIFRNTARTTLFTRMEKIGTRRHFCEAKEIRLLKTVNGIHGSSAICTLIPESDVQRYCEIYIDGTKDLKLYAVRKRIRKPSGKERSKRKSSEATEEVDKDVKSVCPDSHNNSKTSQGRVDGTKHLKRKRRKRVDKQALDDSMKSNDHHKGTNKESIIKSEQLCEVSGLEEDGLSKHVTNFAKTVSLSNTEPAQLNNQLVNASHNGVDITQIEQDKRPQNGDVVMSELYSPLNILQPLDEGENRTNRVTKLSDENTATFRASSSAEIVPEDPVNSHGQNLASCFIRNANSEILFSDASSNDSGFASTVTLSLKAPSAFTTPIKDELRRANNGEIRKRSKSPSKAKKTTPKKIKLDPLVFCSNGKDVSLSPPPLVIKRQNNTWQVETKQDQQTVESIKNQPPNSAKKKLNLSTSGVEGSTQTKHELGNVTKKLINKKKRQKVSAEKGKGVDAKIDKLSDGPSVVKKRRRRRRKKIDGSGISEHLSLNGLNQQDSATSLHETKALLKKKAKKGNIEEGLGHHEMGEVKGAAPPKANTVIVTANSTTEFTESTSSNIPVNNCTKVKRTRKRKNKAYRNFKLLSMFPAFPTFEVKNGDLSPVYTMGVPPNVKAPIWHPIWKWHLGAPLVENETQSRKQSNGGQRLNNASICKWPGKRNSLANTPVKIG